MYINFHSHHSLYPYNNTILLFNFLMEKICLYHPTTCLVAGPTGCGKTTFVIRVLESVNVIVPKPERVIWVYSEWQECYESLSSKVQIEFKKSCSDLYESLCSEVRNLIVLDDQMSNTAEEKRMMSTLFTKGSHHRNLTIIYLVQNLFDQGVSSRTISLNSQYIVLFKNPRDVSQINFLARQMYPKNSKFLVDSFEDATRAPHSYIFLNLTQACPNYLRVCSNIFPEEDTEVYIQISEKVPSELVYNG